MKIFTVALLFGVIQVFLLRFLLLALTNKKEFPAILLFILKFALYGVGIAKFMFDYIEYFTYVAFGFVIGSVFTAFGLFIFLVYFKKK